MPDEHAWTSHKRGLVDSWPLEKCHPRDCKVAKNDGLNSTLDVHELSLQLVLRVNTKKKVACDKGTASRSHCAIAT